MAKNINDVFIEGMVKGGKIAVFSMVPNIVFAFALIQALKISGLLQLIGDFCQPLMGLFGLPGEAMTVLLTTWLSAVAGVATAASLFDTGVLTPETMSILMPGIFLMGAQLQYAGRILAVADVNRAHYAPLFVISILNALLGMWIMYAFIV